ncbi:MAG TPA: hypothetical protein VGO27_19195 [Candidatus Acidoferrum sp.]|nr:hypothetical protein [Candidatus Acidoferrum sp.]
MKEPENELAQVFFAGTGADPNPCASWMEAQARRAPIFWITSETWVAMTFGSDGEGELVLWAASY